MPNKKKNNRGWPKGKPRKHSFQTTHVSPHPIQDSVRPSYSTPDPTCLACNSKNEMIMFLRQEIVRLSEEKRTMDQRVEKLTDKVVSFSEKATEHEHRLKMTELAHLKPVAMEGMLPRDDLMTDETSKAADDLIDQILQQHR